jgi:hypothetical protein
VPVRLLRRLKRRCNLEEEITDHGQPVSPTDGLSRDITMAAPTHALSHRIQCALRNAVGIHICQSHFAYIVWQGEAIRYDGITSAMDTNSLAD